MRLAAAISTPATAGVQISMKTIMQCEILPALLIASFAFRIDVLIIQQQTFTIIAADLAISHHGVRGCKLSLKEEVLFTLATAQGLNKQSLKLCPLTNLYEQHNLNNHVEPFW